MRTAFLAFLVSFSPHILHAEEHELRFTVQVQTDLGLTGGWAQAGGAQGKFVFGLAQLGPDPTDSIAFRWDGGCPITIPGTAGFMPMDVSHQGWMAGYRFIASPFTPDRWLNVASLRLSNGGKLYEPLFDGNSSGFLSISENGHFAGGYKQYAEDGSYAGFLWSHDDEPILTEILTGGNTACIQAVNSRGEAVGWSNSEFGLEPVRWNNQGKVSRFLPSSIETTNGFAYSMNEVGDIIGSYSESSTGYWRSFILWKHGEITIPDAISLFEMDPSIEVYLYGINNNGTSVGAVRRGTDLTPIIVKKDGEILKLPVPIGFTSGSARTISNNNIVSGAVFDSNYRQYVARWTLVRK